MTSFENYLLYDTIRHLLIQFHSLNNRARIIDDKNLFVKGLKAYHGTQVCNLKSIIEDSGGLLIPGKLEYCIAS